MTIHELRADRKVAQMGLHGCQSMRASAWRLYLKALWPFSPFTLADYRAWILYLDESAERYKRQLEEIDAEIARLLYIGGEP